MTSPTSDRHEPAADETRLTMVDGRDALAFVIVHPGTDGGVTVEAMAKGLPKPHAARVLRHVADMWDADSPGQATDRCTCRQSVHAQQHTTPVADCPWCANLPDVGADYVQPANRPAKWAEMAADLAREGHSPAEIAQKLSVDEPTVARLLDNEDPTAHGDKQ